MISVRKREKKKLLLFVSKSASWMHMNSVMLSTFGWNSKSKKRSRQSIHTLENQLALWMGLFNSCMPSSNILCFCQCMDIFMCYLFYYVWEQQQQQQQPSTNIIEKELWTLKMEWLLLIWYEWMRFSSFLSSLLELHRFLVDLFLSF